MHNYRYDPIFLYFLSTTQINFFLKFSSFAKAPNSAKEPGLSGINTIAFTLLANSPSRERRSFVFEL